MRFVSQALHHGSRSLLGPGLPVTWVFFFEELFIGRYTPELCAQKEFVRNLGLF